MSGHIVQMALIFILTFINTQSKKPPGYVAPPREYDPDPPKYEYGYRIQEDKTTQGKDEQRDGIYAQGRYYVENGTESNQNIRYFADDWGYHPVVQYSNVGPHSRSSTNFVLGEEAIKLKNNQKSIPQDPSDPGKADNLAKLDPSNQKIDAKKQQLTELNTNLRPHQFQTDPSIIPNQELNQPQLDAQRNNENHILQAVLDPSQHLADSNMILGEPTATNSEIVPGQIILQQSPLLLENDPQLRLSANQPFQLQNRQLIVDPSQQQLIPSISQPLFYYIQSQDVPVGSHQELISPLGNIDGIAEQISQFFRKQPLKASNEPTDVLRNNQNNQSPLHGDGFDMIKLETLPKPQALVLDNIPISNNNDLLNSDNVKPISETLLLPEKDPNLIESIENNTSDAQFNSKVNSKETNVSHRKLIESTRNLVSGVDVLNINAAITSNGDENIESSTLQSLLQQYVTPTIDNNKIGVDHSSVISSTTIAPSSTVTTSLLDEPIIVAESELEDELKPVTERTDENKESYSSTARATLKKIDKKVNDELEGRISKQVLVTPRPVSSKFLAPITAGIQLQQVEGELFQNTKTLETTGKKQERVQVQIQKTIPYYLGTYQYPLSYALAAHGENFTENDMSMEQKAVEDIELGRTLLYFPAQESAAAEDFSQDQGIVEKTNVLVNDNTIDSQGQQLATESQTVEEQKVDHNQLSVPETGYQHHELAEIDYQVNSQNNQPDIQKIPEDQQIILPKRPTQVFKARDPLPYPQTYAVEKIVEKRVQVPVEVTKYIDRPYPVEVLVPYPQPYPVEKVVQKIVKEPYPVEVKVPVHVKVPVSHPVPIEKIVEREVPVPYYVEKPVEKIVEKPVERIIEKKVHVPYYIEKSKENILSNNYFSRPTSQAILLQIPGLFSQDKYSTLVQDYLQPPLQYSKESHRQFGNSNFIQQVKYPLLYAPHNVEYMSQKQLNQIGKSINQSKVRKLNLLFFPRQNIANFPPITRNPHDLYRQPDDHSRSFRYSNAKLNNGYLPPLSNHITADQQETSSNILGTHTSKHSEGHIGLVPPKRPLFEDSLSHRHARAHFDDKSIRMEYGFKPPLIPSLEIDERGQPIEKDDNGA